jgi:predicted ester cyclase
MKRGGKPSGILPCWRDPAKPSCCSVDSVSELNKQKVRLFVEAVWNEGRLELIDELVADDYVGRVPCADLAVLGPQGVRRLVSSQRRAHPDLYVKIDDQIAEDDRVVTRWQATAPTSCFAGISIIRLLAGKQVDSHTEYTNLGAEARPNRSPQLTAGPSPSLRPPPS